MKRGYQLTLFFVVFGLVFVGLLYFMAKDPSVNRKTYKIISNNTVFFAASYDTIPNGIQFIDVRRNTLIKVHGHFVIEEPKK